MRTQLKTTSIALSILIFVLSSNDLLSQGPPPPPGDPSAGGVIVGGNAPIGDGLIILSSFALIYVLIKLFFFWKPKTYHLLKIIQIGRPMT